MRPQDSDIRSRDRCDAAGRSPEGEADRRRVERRQGRRFVLRERRSGFDRRQREPSNSADAALAQLRARPDVVMLVILTINLLSAVDAVLTLNALSFGVREANPILRALIEQEPTLWIWAKAALVGTISYVLWVLRRYRLGLIAALLGLAVFTVVLMWHIVGSIALFY